MKNYTKSGRRALCNITTAIFLSSMPILLKASGDYEVVISEEGVEKAYISAEYIRNIGVGSLDGFDKHIIWVMDNKNKQGIFRCDNYTKNIRSVFDLPDDRSDPIWIEYSLNASKILLECDGWKYIAPTDLRDIKSIRLWISDGYPDKYGRISGIFITDITVLPTPTLCVTSELPNIDFGTINTSENSTIPQGISRFVVECNKTSRIDFTVNNGESLVNDDGSRISFSVWSPSDAPAGIPTEIQIRGTMTTAPTKPGSYQWYVPILFSYE